ncbi:MAG: hypothetical protein AAGC46_15910, partial [Solirubrobacteraceae bacterium]|nr:hypothetical protein [Patulibacter sp.]
MVESRGRTGARAVGSTGARGTGPREPQPANWNKALLKGLIPLVILGVVLAVTSKEKNVTQI